MKCLVELRPERHLLQPNFDGYKLTLDSISIKRKELTSKIDRVYPSDDQYSLIHAKLFGLHNHLINDNWEKSGVYYIDDHWFVCRILVGDQDCSQDVEKVYEIPSHVEREPGHYNTSLHFCSEQYAVLADGAGSLHIVRTGNRMRPGIVWENVFSNQILGEGIFFVIVDSRLEIENGKEVIHCLLQHVQQSEKLFQSVIEWVSIQKENKLWSILAIRQLKGQGSLHYAALEPKCMALYIASDHPFSFASDSSNEIIPIGKTETKDLKKITYTWLQTGEDITVTLQLGNKSNKSLVDIVTGKNTLTVLYDSKSLLEGELMEMIDNELTTWNLENEGKLDILLTKSASGLLWSDLLKDGDVNGEQVLEPSLVEEVHRRLSHLCSDTEEAAETSAPAFSNQQLEECDAVSEENTCLVRLDSSSHSVTHQAPLSSHQVLLSVCLNPSEPLALGLRHDVDACIWQPHKATNEDKIWPIKHEGTLLAFGYVQSSKQQRKFTVCSPNMEYSAVCEANRHVFVYRKESQQSRGCQLRQRNSSGENRQVKVGQQQVVSLDKDGELLGICSTNEYLYILTVKYIIMLQME